MEEYDFTLRFALGKHDDDPEAFLERLSKAGCDDALIGIGKPGRIALAFTREAASAEAAVISALADVKRVVSDAVFLEATPDYVGVPDIAEVLGVSRQYIGKIIKASEREFPPPIHDGARAMWHLEAILKWLTDCGMREVDEHLLKIARVNRQCNYARESARLGRDIPRNLKNAIA